MIKIFINICLFTFLLFPIETIEAKSNLASLPKTFSLIGLSGGKLVPADIKNRYVIMQFWASWCIGCKATMKTMNHLFGDSKSVSLVTISVDETMEDAKKYFKNLPKSYDNLKSKSYWDPGAKIAEALQVQSIPTIILLDKKSRTIEMIRGHPNKVGS